MVCDCKKDDCAECAPRKKMRSTCNSCLLESSLILRRVLLLHHHFLVHLPTVGHNGKLVTELSPALLAVVLGSAWVLDKVALFERLYGGFDQRSEERLADVTVKWRGCGTCRLLLGYLC